MSFGVYRIVTPSGKYYVGMTMRGFEFRWAKHLKELKRGVHKCTGLLNAYQRYGWDAFRFEILESWDDERTAEALVLQREQYWWDYFSAYGENPLHGRPTGTGSVYHSDKSRQALSATLEANFLSKHGLIRDQIRRDKRGRVQVSKKCRNSNCKAEYWGSMRDQYCSLQCSLRDPNKTYGPAKKPRNEMKATILALRQDGFSWGEISEKVALSTRTVRRYVNEY